MTELRPMQGRSIEDAELAERARDGDVGAYEELVTRYQSIAYRVAWLVARNAGDAEDAVQEAFVKAYFGLPRFRRGAPFKPWLLRIVANEAKNRLRSARRREALAVKAIATRPGEAARSPEDAALSRDDAEALTEALDRLNERDRLVIAYRYLLDMSEAEVAAALGLRRGTVKSRLSRAMTKLRIELGAEEMTG